jgi:hypothetical protein
MSRALARSLSLLAISCSFLPPLGRDSGQEARVPTQSAKTRDKDYKNKNKKKEIEIGGFFFPSVDHLFLFPMGLPTKSVLLFVRNDIDIDLFIF